MTDIDGGYSILLLISTVFAVVALLFLWRGRVRYKSLQGKAYERAAKKTPNFRGRS